MVDLNVGASSQSAPDQPESPSGPDQTAAAPFSCPFDRRHDRQHVHAQPCPRIARFQAAAQLSRPDRRLDFAEAAVRAGRQGEQPLDARARSSLECAVERGRILRQIAGPHPALGERAMKIGGKSGSTACARARLPPAAAAPDPVQPLRPADRRVCHAAEQDNSRPLVAVSRPPWRLADEEIAVRVSQSKTQSSSGSVKSPRVTPPAGLALRAAAATRSGGAPSSAGTYLRR